jgi:hypothetical protein
LAFACFSCISWRRQWDQFWTPLCLDTPSLLLRVCVCVLIIILLLHIFLLRIKSFFVCSSILFLDSICSNVFPLLILSRFFLQSLFMSTVPLTVYIRISICMVALCTLPYLNVCMTVIIIPDLNVIKCNPLKYTASLF